MLLEDGKAQEEICIAKYSNYAGQAQDPQLKQLFNQLSGQEQQHYDTLCTLLQGQQPKMSNSQQQQGSQSQQQTTQMKQSTYQGAMSNTGDKMLCSDLLSTEKHVSSLYDTMIFECQNPTVRQSIQHIQKEEQNHGEQIFNYMNSNGMYSVQ